MNLDKKTKRIESIDYMRGLMALSIVIYHYAAWGIAYDSPGQAMPSGSLLSRLGIYAVSIFYIISGLSLYIAYEGRLNTFKDAAVYAVKRVFRIFPLFWLVFTLGLLLGLASSLIKGVGYSFPFYETILNYTLTFGFIDPSAYITVGAWSIGNEMVFYAIFAVVLLSGNRYPIIIPISIILSAIIGCFFAYDVLSSDETLEAQWDTYINPFNQVVLFFLGVSIGKYAGLVKRILPGRWACGLILSIGVVVFCAYPISGARIALVVGHARLVLVISCALVILAIFVMDPVFHPVISKPLEFLGQASYSIYLMHPIVAVPITYLGNRLGFEIWLSYFIALIATLVIGWLTYHCLETPMMRKGRLIAAKIKQPNLGSSLAR